MIPFFQGKLDNFCAVYAVLNALQLLCGVSAFQVRSLFAELLLSQSRDPDRFRSILYHSTDYNEMVDDFFRQIMRQYPVTVSTPFPEADEKSFSADTIWQTLTEYARPEEGRSAVFRFCRYAPLASHPMADHWTTACRVEGNSLHFFDCSKEEHGLYALHRHSLKDRARLRPLEYVLVPPRSIRLVTCCSDTEARQRTDSWLY